MKTQNPRPPCRDSKETAKLAGYKNVASFHDAVQHGAFPAASFAVPATRGPRHFWNLAVIEAEMKRREQLKKEKSRC
jgi:hypothetical protein